MENDTDYEQMAMRAIASAWGTDGELRVNFLAEAQVYATLHLADVQRPRQELALDPALTPRLVMKKLGLEEIEPQHPVLDVLVYENGETLRQRLERKQTEYAEMWVEIFKMVAEAERKSS